MSGKAAVEIALEAVLHAARHPREVVGLRHRRFEMDAIARRDRVRIARAVRRAFDDGRLLVHARAQAREVVRAHARQVRMRYGRGVHQDQSRHALRMAQRVLQRQHRAPRMAEQHRCVEIELAADAVDVVQVGGEAHALRVHAGRRASPAALVVVNQPVRVGERVEIGREVRLVEIGPAVQHDNGLAVADRADVKRRVVGAKFAFFRARHVPGLRARRERDAEQRGARDGMQGVAHRSVPFAVGRGQRAIPAARRNGR